MAMMGVRMGVKMGARGRSAVSSNTAAMRADPDIFNRRPAHDVR
jgi:hypothetical protein